MRDILENDGFHREVNGETVPLSEEWQGRYARSVNSVIYFALLPFPLNDSAVKKRYLGTEAIRGKSYHKIEVTFHQEKGGRDFDDVFIYWIHQEKHTMDYLAYEFHVDGGGLRFREAFNQRRVDGILFADFHNFKGDKSALAVSDLANAFVKGKLEKASEIVLENIKVELKTGIN